MNIPITNGTVIITDVDDVCDRIERKIVELENENPANPLIQKLLDLEANIVLQEYYQSDEYQEALAWDILQNDMSE